MSDAAYQHGIQFEDDDSGASTYNEAAEAAVAKLGLIGGQQGEPLAVCCAHKL